MRLIPLRSRLLLAVLLASSSTALLAACPLASASGKQVSIFEDDSTILRDPGSTLQELRHLGVRMVRLGVHWSSIAPSPNSLTRPQFNASDPNSYPPGAWSIYDTIVSDARADGIQLMFVPTAFAPLWAQGANPQKYGAHYDPKFAFMPSASEFKQWITALGKRYPSVHIWELYNEANFGEDLAPQAINGSHVLYAPVMYRSLIAAAWGGLQTTGHGRDTILIGALAANGSHVPTGRGSGAPGTYGETPPLEFIRDLYCVDARYHQYRGPAAAVRKCPTTAAASASFRSQNPALFSPSGWSIHPYPLGVDGTTPPTTTRFHNPDYVSFSQLPNMAKTLDRIQGVYRSGKRFPIWNTEYGYITNPPNRLVHSVSPATQAYYDNWAEYLAWRNPRIASTMQYLLIDPNPSVGTAECGGFASGLIFYSSAPTTGGCSSYPPGAPKPGYDAYRLPIFLSSSRARPGHALTVWGCIRPALFAGLDVHTRQAGLIQFQRGSRGAWTTVATVHTSANCYFNVPVKFPASGSVRLAWFYPAQDTQLEPALLNGYTDALEPSVSRTVTVSIR